VQRIHNHFALLRRSTLSALASPRGAPAALRHFPIQHMTSSTVMAVLCSAVMIGSTSAQVSSDTAGIASVLTAGALSGTAAAQPTSNTARQTTVPALSAYAMPARAAVVSAQSIVTTTPSAALAPVVPVAVATPVTTATAATVTPTLRTTGPAPTPTTAINASVTAPVLPPAQTMQSAELTKETPLIGVVGDPIAELPPSDLWDRIRAGYAMPDLDDPLVAKWEKFYSERPEYMARIVDRSGKYMFYIVTELERRGMPLEIALLPMIESAFNPIANSSAKASGIWQFIPSTGTSYGMKQDWWSDSRRDIVKATNGALDYLSNLNGMFGDWQLALASYNWGEGSVGRAVQKAKARNLDGSYLSLDMPAETRNYLPKLQAVKNIIRNPAAFGITIATIPNEPYFKTITLANPIDLKRAAQLAEMTEADFVALNPAHNRPVIGGSSEYQVLLPATKADSFLAQLETSEKPRVSWMAYRTRVGDRIEALAQRFGTSVTALKSVNGIRSVASTLPAGYHLLVPTDGPSEDALGSIQNAVFTKFPEYVPPRVHTVRRGDTFAGIAKRYGVKPATLAQWNRMGKQTARAGQTLYVSGPAPVRHIASAKGGRVVQVRRGGKMAKATVRQITPMKKRGVVTSKKVVKRKR
jgi:membrane-bound lytic murein transglycosylase D